MCNYLIPWTFTYDPVDIPEKGKGYKLFLKYMTVDSRRRKNGKEVLSTPWKRIEVKVGQEMEWQQTEEREGGFTFFRRKSDAERE